MFLCLGPFCKAMAYIITQHLAIEAKLWFTHWSCGLVMQRRCVETESITHKYCNSSTKPKFYKNTRLIGKIIEKNLSNKLLFKNTHHINNLSIKSIYRNRISPTPFKKRNNKLISTRERKNNLTRKRKTIKIPIQLGKRF